MLDYICFVLCSAVSSLLTYMSLQMGVACHVALWWSFALCLLLLFGAMYWDDVELPGLVGIVLLNCGPCSPFRAWMKKQMGSIYTWIKNQDINEQEITSELILPFVHFRFFSLCYCSTVMSSLLGVIWVWGFILPWHVLTVKFAEFWVTIGTYTYIDHATLLCRWVDEVFWTVFVEDEGISLQKGGHHLIFTSILRLLLLCSYLGHSAVTAALLPLESWTL